MKKILTAGGAGYIGSHTVVELVKAGYTPIIVDNFSTSNKSVIKGLTEIIGHAVTLYEGDCNDEAFLKNLFIKEKNISGAIHFAAYKAVGESVADPIKYYQNNIGSLATLLKVMQTHGARDCVFSSSCTVYGQPDTLPVTEAYPRKPAESPYGNTKQISEDILQDVVNSAPHLKEGQTPLAAVALRYFNPIGAHPSALIGELPIGTPNNLVPFVTQTAAGLRDKITVFGGDYNTPDGTCIRDYIHVVDLAQAHVKALNYLENKKEQSTVYDIFNIGAGHGYSVLNVLKTFEEVWGHALNYSIGARRSGDIEQIFANADKAQDELNWQAQLSLKTALEDAWRWQQQLKHQ